MTADEVELLLVDVRGGIQIEAIARLYTNVGLTSGSSFRTFIALRTGREPVSEWGKSKGLNFTDWFPMADGSSSASRRVIMN
jgi:hypothetical protein